MKFEIGLADVDMREVEFYEDVKWWIYFEVALAHLNKASRLK